MAPGTDQSPPPPTLLGAHTECAAEIIPPAYTANEADTLYLGHSNIIPPAYTTAETNTTYPEYSNIIPPAYTNDEANAPTLEYSNIIPPAYTSSEANGPSFEDSPSYFRATHVKGAAGYHFNIPHRGHEFANTQEVQLTPGEVALLRDGWMLDIWVAVPEFVRHDKGMKASMGRFSEQARRMCVLKKARVKSKNVDDYGRWVGRAPRGSMVETLRAH